MAGGPREPGSLHEEVRQLASGRAPAGSLLALPAAEVAPLEAEAVSEPNGVGDAMRRLEAARANALQPNALQTETTEQVRLFALLTKLVHTSRNVESQV